MIDLTQIPKRLKQSILMEAMQGKLTKQLPSDGNSEDLLNSIILKQPNKSIKNSGKLSSIKKGNIPFKIPKNWVWTNLYQLCTIKTGKLNANAKRENGIYPFYTCSKKVYRINKYDYCGNDITVAGNGDIGNLHLTHGKFNAYQRTYILSNINLNIKFLYYSLYLLLLPEIKSNIKGSVIRYITLKALQYIFIPLPPLAEQKRIVQRLDQILPKINDLNKDVIRLHSIRKSFPHRLKQSLLMEAMQGKLTKQLPSDGTADELLQRIQQKKRTLIKAGKIRRHKKLPSVSNDKIPFNIPKNWKWVRLGNIGSWKSGATPRRSNKSYYHGRIPWLKTGDLNDGYVSNTSEHISKGALDHSSMRLNPIGSVLIAMYGVGTIGKLGISSVPLTTNQACCACVPYCISNKFLFYFLLLERNNFNELRVGVGSHQNISRTRIVHYLFPLPPLTEQKRIIIKLDKLFSLF